MSSKAKATYVEDPLPLLGEKHVQDSEPSGDSPIKFDAHNLVLFYDLFFAANLTAFSNIHETTNGERLVAYVGYFLVLWFLWLDVMLFDVRFVVDSVMERVLRAIQLGAMVGISVVAPQYNPAQQIKGTFQAFSIILMFARIVLALQYGLAILRRPKEARIGLTIMSACHGAAALVYLGITFRFTDSTNSRVFVAWYIIGFIETFVIFAVSSYYNTELGFHRNALPDRMKTTTLLILGEGIIVVAEHVSTVVKNANSWNSETVGVLTATAALIYIMFQIYFDWAWPAALKNLSPEPFIYAWTLFHLPFHIALALIMEGATQFVVWWKIVEMIVSVGAEFRTTYTTAIEATHSGIGPVVAERLNSTIQSIWEHYPPVLLVTHYHVDALLNDIRATDDSHWTGFPSLDEIENGVRAHEAYDGFVDKFRALKLTVLNSILKSFNIDAIEDAGWQDHPETYEEHAYNDTSERFKLVYIYVFCFAGAILIIMSLLHVLSRMDRRSTQMQRIVIGAIAILGMGLMLLSSMAQFDARTRFSMTPWIIPSLCIVYLCALVLVHIPRVYGRKDENQVEDQVAGFGPGVAPAQEKTEQTSATADVEQDPE